MPDIKAYVGSFTTVNGVNSATITGIRDRDGNAFVPKLLVFFGNVEGFLDTSTMVVFDSTGFDDGTEAHGTSYGWFWFDTIPWSAWVSKAANSLLRNIFRFSPAAIVVGKVTALASGSFTYTLTSHSSAEGIETTFSFLALGGDDLQVKIGVISNNNIGVHSITGVGFQPKGGIFMTRNGNASSGNAGVIPNLGFVGTDIAQQYSASGVMNEVAAPARASKALVQGYNSIIVAPSPGTLTLSSKINSWDADGFTYEILDTAFDFLYVLLGVDDPDTTIQVGTFLQKTTNGSQQVAISNDTPIFMLCASVGGATSPTIQDDCAWSLGAFDGNRARSTWNAGLRGSGPAGDGGAVYGSDNLIFFGTPDGQLSSDSIVTGKLRGSNFNANGFRGNWTEVDGLAREIMYISLGIPVVASPLSGIYKLEPGKTNDTVYTGFDPTTTENRKIP